MDFKKYFCPVCGNDFTEDDDVVVCPDCGTPHHRQCWEKIGQCSNEKLHGTGDSAECTYKKADSLNEEPVQAQEPKKEQDIPQFGGFNPFSANNQEETYRPTEYYINGKPSVYYEIAVKKNQSYYIPRFLVMDKGDKSPGSWNFVSFLFPLAWALYRKMYKLAALVFAVYIAISGLMVYSVFSDTELFNSFNACYQEDPNFINDVMTYMGDGGSVVLTPNQKEFIKHYEDYSQPSYLYWATMILSYGIKIFVALKGNKLYLNKLTKSIDKGEKTGLEGDALKAYIRRKNGVLPFIFVFFVALFEWSF